MADTRESIEVPGLAHENPFPTATRIGPFLVTSGIYGKDPETGKVPAEIEAQCALMFANVRRTLEAAGGSTDNILKVTVWLKDKATRPHVNKEWLLMFPDPKSRPVRHSLVYQDLPPGALVQCEVMAVLTR